MASETKEVSVAAAAPAWLSEDTRRWLDSVNAAQLVKSFVSQGYVVLPQVLSPDDVSKCRTGFHSDLKKWGGVDYSDLAGTMTNLSTVQTHYSGGMPFHYSPWRMLHCVFNERVFAFTSLLWEATYATGKVKGFECPHAPFPTDKGYALIDSLNFRLPSALVAESFTRMEAERAAAAETADAKDATPSKDGAENTPKEKLVPMQKPLTHHIDVNPWDKWGGWKGKTRWRPFQGFISLTDHSGGFECCPAFHVELDQFFHNIPKAKNVTGSIRLEGKKYASIRQRFQSVPYKAGDAVLWDWRLPHKVADVHPGPDTREVVYTSFLPDIPLNRKYAAQQWALFTRGDFPPGYSGLNALDTNWRAEVLANEKDAQAASVDTSAAPLSTDKVFSRGQRPAERVVVPGWDPALRSTLAPVQRRILHAEPWP